LALANSCQIESAFGVGSIVLHRNRSTAAQQESQRTAQGFGRPGPSSGAKHETTALKVNKVEIEKVNVLGVGISVLDQDRAREFLFEALRERRRGYVTITMCFINRKDREVRMLS
jgi:hypothetical protein